MTEKQVAKFLKQTTKGNCIIINTIITTPPRAKRTLLNMGLDEWIVKLEIELTRKLRSTLMTIRDELKALEGE